MSRVCAPSRAADSRERWKCELSRVCLFSCHALFACSDELQMTLAFEAETATSANTGRRDSDGILDRHHNRRRQSGPEERPHGKIIQTITITITVAADFKVCPRPAYQTDKGRLNSSGYTMGSENAPQTFCLCLNIILTREYSEKNCSATGFTTPSHHRIAQQPHCGQTEISSFARHGCSESMSTRAHS